MDQQVSRGGDWIDDDEIVLDANESFDDDFDGPDSIAPTDMNFSTSKMVSLSSNQRFEAQKFGLTSCHQP